MEPKDEQNLKLMSQTYICPELRIITAVEFVDLVVALHLPIAKFFMPFY